jgi:hypothetical protein
MRVLRGAVLTAAGVLLVQVLVAVGLVPLLASTGAGPNVLLLFGVVVAALLRALVGLLVARRQTRAGAAPREVRRAVGYGSAGGYLPIALLQYWEDASVEPFLGLVWVLVGLAVTVATALLGVWWYQRRSAAP